MNYAIIYHATDFDGKMSNEVCRHFLSANKASVQSFGWDYGRPVPDAKWGLFDEIYIVDLAVDELMARPDLRQKIIWIDHHATSIKKWDVDPFGRPENDGGPTYALEPLKGYRVDGVAACRLCWQWFTGAETLPGKKYYDSCKVTEPKLIRLVGQHDVWDHRDPDAKPLQFGLRLLSSSELYQLASAEFWGTPSKGPVTLEQVIAKGAAIKAYCDKQNDTYSRACSHTLNWEGLKFCTLNIGQFGNSDLLRGGIKPEHDALFAWRYDGSQVVVSLYQIEGKTQEDLSQIAIRYGGGGHRGACGFRTTLAKLAEILEPQK